MAKDFIITESDIDRELDLLVEVTKFGSLLKSLKYAENNIASATSKEGTWDALKDRRALGDREPPAPKDADSPSSKDDGEEKSVSKKKEKDEVSIQKLQSFVDDNQRFHEEVLNVLDEEDINDIVFLAQELPGLPPVTLQEGTLGQDLEKWISRGRCGQAARALLPQLVATKEDIAHELAKVKKYEDEEKDPVNQKKDVARFVLRFSNLFKGALQVLDCSKEKPPEEECPEGQKKNEEGECVDRCPEGSHWVPAEGKCVEDGEDEAEEEKPAQIIIPDWNPTTGGATNWMGQTSFSGDTAGKMVNDFLENKPGIGRYAYEFSNLLRVYATMQMIKAPNVASSRAERERQRYLGSTAQSGAPTEPASGTGPNRRQATLQEAVSDSMLKEMEGNFKDYLKGDVRRAIAATDNKEEFGKFVEGEIKKLKAAKTKVDASSDLTKAYNDISAYGQLVGKLMIRFANILDQNWRDLFPALAKKSEEEEESVTEPTETEETEETEEKEEMLNEDKLTEIVIDFNEIRKNELNESFLAMFGAWIKHILGAMLGGFNIPVSVRGSKGEVESFARAVGSEKKYIETAKRYGLDHPNTYKSQARLGTATKGFEKETGIKWPFK